MGLLARWAHLAALAWIFGTCLLLVAMARPAARAGGPEVEGWLTAVDGRLLAWVRRAVVVALVAGLLDLWRQLGVATEAGPLGSLAPGPALGVLGGTRYGLVWLARHALLGMLGVTLLLVSRDASGTHPADWLALRLQGLVLSGAALVIGVAASHAASAEGNEVTAILVDAGHALGSGAWVGALGPLLIGLREARRLEPPLERAVVTALAQRFSVLGLLAVAVLLTTGVANASFQVAGYPALFGTTYGQLLLVKLLLTVPLLLSGAVNLLVLQPALVRASASPRAVTRRLRRSVAVEVGLAFGILGVVAALGLTTPARHAAIDWPFTFRLSWEVTRALPGVTWRVAVGSQLAVLGLMATLLGLLVRRRRAGLVVAAGLAAIAGGLWVAIPPLAVDAYSATYWKPTVPYSAASIVAGDGHYRASCQACHGAGGRGDGPAGRTLWPPPADLTAGHTGDHTAGDLFWWVTHGLRVGMPAFAGQLDADGRWQVINYVRALSAATVVEGLGPGGAPPAPGPAFPGLGGSSRPRRVVAPDFTYGVGVGDNHALRDLRGDRVVLVVLFSLPRSLDRLGELALIYPLLYASGGEILAVPTSPEPDLYRRLGGRVLPYPFVVDGAVETAQAYGVLLRPVAGRQPGGPARDKRHTELLVDRQGYLRARWDLGEPDGWSSLSSLLEVVRGLAAETALGPLADEHVH